MTPGATGILYGSLLPHDRLQALCLLFLSRSTDEILAPHSLSSSELSNREHKCSVPQAPATLESMTLNFTSRGSQSRKYVVRIKKKWLEWETSSVSVLWLLYQSKATCMERPGISRYGLNAFAMVIYIRCMTKWCPDWLTPLFSMHIAQMCFSAGRGSSAVIHVLSMDSMAVLHSLWKISPSSHTEI